MLCLETGQTLQGIAGVGSRITYTIEGVEIDGAAVEVYKTLAQGQLPTSAGTLYTAPSGKIALVKSMHFMCAGASTTMSLYAGGNADANALLKTFSLGTNFVLSYEEGGWSLINGAGYKLLRSA